MRPAEIVSDTDHRLGAAGDQAWVRKTFTRGLNVSNDMELRDLRADDPRLERARRATRDVRRLSARLDLAAMMPRPEWSSTGPCLAAVGAEYLVYQPEAPGARRKPP